MVAVEVVPTDELGDRSYIAHDGALAIVIDPQRDLDRIESVLEERGLRCAFVLETHIHNDYVSGGLELARRTGAEYVVSAEEDVAFERRPVHDGEILVAGDLRIRVLSTPGHTPGHLSFLVQGPGGVPAAFTGGSLLYGSVGRTDLVDPTLTEELTHRQYRSAHQLARIASDDSPVYPTHGFGSFCSSGSATGGDSSTRSTIGNEKRYNDALVADDEDSFVQALIAGLTAYPAYYDHMGPRNRLGAGPVDLSTPKVVGADELAKAIAGGDWVIDLRERRAFATDHIRGTLNFALDTPFSTYVGWLLPWGTALVMIGESTEELVNAQRQLVRIGIDRPDSVAIGPPDELTGGRALASYPVVSFDSLADQHDALVLDVRRDDERRSGHLAGSLHIPLHQLGARLGELPVSSLWVHCASGYRASIAASQLDATGHRVVLIDDDWENAESSGRPIESADRT
ncbi:MAG: MBL fold metallo-hydrolase [Acidimicrobiales bacterium]